MMKTANGNAEHRSISRFDEKVKFVNPTVTKNELPNAGDDHCDRAQKVVVCTEANESVWRKGALELAQRENS